MTTGATSRQTPSRAPVLRVCAQRLGDVVLSGGAKTACSDASAARSVTPGLADGAARACVRVHSGRSDGRRVQRSSAARTLAPASGSPGARACVSRQPLARQRAAKTARVANARPARGRTASTRRRREAGARPQRSATAAGHSRCPPPPPPRRTVCAAGLVTSLGGPTFASVLLTGGNVLLNRELLHRRRRSIDHLLLHRLVHVGILDDGLGDASASAWCWAVRLTPLPGRARGHRTATPTGGRPSATHIQHTPSVRMPS